MGERENTLLVHGWTYVDSWFFSIFNNFCVTIPEFPLNEQKWSIILFRHKKAGLFLISRQEKLIWILIEFKQAMTEPSRFYWKMGQTRICSMNMAIFIWRRHHYCRHSQEVRFIRISNNIFENIQWMNIIEKYFFSLQTRKNDGIADCTWGRCTYLYYTHTHILHAMWCPFSLKSFQVNQANSKGQRPLNRAIIEAFRHAGIHSMLFWAFFLSLNRMRWIFMNLCQQDTKSWLSWWLKRVRMSTPLKTNWN